MTLMAENRPVLNPSSWAPSSGGALGSVMQSLGPSTQETKGHAQPLGASKPSSTGTPPAPRGPAAAPIAQPAMHAVYQAVPCDRSPLSELPTTNAREACPPMQPPPQQEDPPRPSSHHSTREPRASNGPERTDRGAGCTDKQGGVCTDRLAEFRERYEVGRVLGRGAFGDVMECTERATRRVWACKVVDTRCLASQEEREALAREIHIMGRLKGQHHGIVQLKETFPPSWCTGGTPSTSISSTSTSTNTGSPGSFFSAQGLVYPGSPGSGAGKNRAEGLVRIVMEKCGGGDLYNAIATRGRMPEVSAKHVFCQVASTLAFCHARGVIHRDVKPENILFSTSPDCLFAHASTLPRLSASGEMPRVQAKLADFGLSVLVRPGQTTTGLLGSRFYTAPEVLKGMRYGRRVDVWGLGVCLYAMLSGRLPFVGRSGDDEEGLKSAILRGRVAFDRPGWEGVSESAKDLVKRMLHPEPQRRIQSRELLAHPWCAGHLSPAGGLPSPLTVPYILTIPSPVSKSGPLPSPLDVPTPLCMPSPALKPAPVTVRVAGGHSKAGSPATSSDSCPSAAVRESEHLRLGSPALAATSSIPLSAQLSCESLETESESEAEEDFGWGFGVPSVRAKGAHRPGRGGKRGKRLDKHCSAGEELSAKAHPLWAMLHSLRLGATQSYSAYCQTGLDCRRA